MFLDEPTAGMNWHDKIRLIDLLNAYPNKSVIISTHDPDLDDVGQIIQMNSSP